MEETNIDNYSKIKINCKKILDHYCDINILDDEEIERLKNINSQEKCFVLGNGPSLNKFDLNNFDNKFTIACNAFYFGTMENKINFAPDILCCGDRTLTKNILEKDCNYIMGNYKDINLVLHPTFITISRMSSGMRNNYKKYKNNIYNIKNFEKFILTKEFVPEKVIQSNIRSYCKIYKNIIPMISMLIAEKLGFKKIYLIGVDCNNVFEHFYKKKTHKNTKYEKKHYKNIYNGFKIRFEEFQEKNIDIFIENKNTMFDFLETFDV